VDPIHLTEEINKLNSEELLCIFTNIAICGTDKTKRVPKSFYSTVKTRCMNIVDETIKRKEHDVRIPTLDLIYPYTVYAESKMREIYNECSEYYWNHFGIDVLFAGYDLGSVASLYYTLDPDDFQKQLQRTYGIVEINTLQTNDRVTHYLQTKLNERVTQYLGLFIKECEFMKSDEIKPIEFLDNLIMIGWQWPYFYRMISTKLEELKLGKIIKVKNIENIQRY
jgi:hypothetical protein